ncbi:MAG: hypothetical protein AABY14_00780, partial [Nanoarchaeota archaeon]
KRLGFCRAVPAKNQPPLTKSILIIILLITLSYKALSEQLTYDTTANNVTISYDDLNRIKAKNTTGINITYTYDSQLEGTLTNVTTNNITIKYKYDNKKRITKETRIIDGITFEKNIAYDSSNRPIQAVITNNDLEYYHNKQGKISKILSNTAPYYIKSATYNAFATVTQREYGNNLLTNISYNSGNNRIATIKTASSQNLAYEYDNAGNIMAIKDTANRINITMGYDSLDRLTNTTMNNNRYQYEYDAIGNIKRIVSGNTSKRLIYNNNIPHAPSQIIDGISGAGIYHARTLSTGNINKTIEFFLIPEKKDPVLVNWTLNTGDKLITGNITINITNSVMVLVQNNFSSGGAYNLNISSGYDSNAFTERFGIKSKSLSLLKNNKSIAHLEFLLTNDLS